MYWGAGLISPGVGGISSMNLQQALPGGKGSPICQPRKLRRRRGWPEVCVLLACHPFPLCPRLLSPWRHKDPLSLTEETAGLERSSGAGT